MRIDKITAAVFTATFLQCCAPQQEVVRVEVPGAEQKEPSMTYDLEDQVIRYGSVQYNLKGRPARTNRENFGPALPETITNLYLTRDRTGKEYKFATESYTEGRPHTVWLQIPGAWLKIEIGRDRSVWGEQRLDKQPDQLEDRFYTE